MSSHMFARRVSFQCFRISVAVILIVLILQWVDFGAALQTITKADLRYVLLVVFLGVFDRCLMGYKWALLLRAKGVGISNAEAFRVYMASYFVGSSVPLAIGGDIFRVFRTTGNDRKVEQITASIVMERVIGLLAMAVLAFLGLTALVHERQFVGLYYSVLVFLLMLMLGLFLSIQTRTRNLVRRYLSRFEKYKPIRMYLDFHIAYVELSRHREVLLLFFVLSVFEQGVQSVIVFCTAEAAGLSTSMIYFVAITPLSILVTTLPISINAIGVQEGAYAVLFALAGLSATESFSLSLLVRAIGWITLIPCGFVFLYDSMKFKQLRQLF